MKVTATKALCHNSSQADQRLTTTWHLAAIISSILPWSPWQPPKHHSQARLCRSMTCFWISRTQPRQLHVRLPSSCQVRSTTQAWSKSCRPPTICLGSPALLFQNLTMPPPNGFRGTERSIDSLNTPCNPKAFKTTSFHCSCNRECGCMDLCGGTCPFILWPGTDTTLDAGENEPW